MLISLNLERQSTPNSSCGFGTSARFSLTTATFRTTEQPRPEIYLPTARVRVTPFPSTPLRRPRKISPEEIVERCFYALVNEGFRCLEEGIAEHPDDIDVVWAYGYSWPGWRGGPMFWADEIGARTLVRQMVR